MNIVRYNYKNFQVVFNMNDDGRLWINCTIDDQSFQRIYNIKDVDHVTCDGEYMYFLTVGSEFMYQLKMEYGSCLVIDKFNGSGSELLDEIGAWDFNDEVVID